MAQAFGRLGLFFGQNDTDSFKFQGDPKIVSKYKHQELPLEPLPKPHSTSSWRKHRETWPRRLACRSTSQTRD
jgi:hypothetical protein